MALHILAALVIAFAALGVASAAIYDRGHTRAGGTLAAIVFPGFIAATALLVAASHGRL